MELVLKYFPELTGLQKERFSALFDLYNYWNERINVISRKDMDNFYLHHVLHSLAIARVCGFGAGARVMDVGTGGGFPGIPLAIMFPEARFTLVDSIGKKTRVAGEVAKALGLDNVRVVNGRAESVDEKFDFVVSRAVTDMKTFTGWVWDRIERGRCDAGVCGVDVANGSAGGGLSNGILYLKGGDLEAELAAVGKPYAVYDISDFFSENFFETKKVVYIPK